MKHKKAVIDRIEDGRIAVVFLEGSLERFDLPVSLLPDGAREGDWLKLEVCEGKIVGIEIDKEETERNRKKIRKKFEELRRKG